MALSPREKKLVLALPAVAVVLGYGLLVGRGQQAKLAQSRKAAADARTAAPSPALIAEQQARLAAVLREVNQTQKDLEAARKRWQAAAGRTDHSPNRPERIEQLNRLLASSGLRVIDAADADSKEGRSFPAAETLAKTMADLADNTQPKPRVLRFYGRYPEVTATLAALNRGDVLAVPLGLTMKEADPETAWREWSLLVWV